MDDMVEIPSSELEALKRTVRELERRVTALEGAQPPLRPQTEQTPYYPPMPQRVEPKPPHARPYKQAWEDPPRSPFGGPEITALSHPTKSW